MMNGWEDTASWCPLLSGTSTCWTKLKEEFRIEIADGIYVDRLVWQIIEYFVEHRDNTENMIDIAAKLGIPQSSFSKKVKLLKEYGFIDRFIAEGNKKEIFIRPTGKSDPLLPEEFRR